MVFHFVGSSVIAAFISHSIIELARSPTLRHGTCQVNADGFTDCLNKEGIMISTGLKKVMASMTIAAGLIVGAGFIGDSSGSSPINSVANAQRRTWGRTWDRRGWDRDGDWRIRIMRLDRDRQIRYRTNTRGRMVGYYDRFGRFHAYGLIDRFGRFHRF